MFYQPSSYYRQEQLADNLYTYIWQGRGNNCNTSLFTHVLRGKRPHVVVDPGMIIDEVGENCFEYLSKAMEQDGFKAEDIGLIINTHSHIDHCQSNETIIEKSQADVTLSEEEDRFRHTRGDRINSMFGRHTPEFTPLCYLKEGKLNLGADNKVELEVILAPGHSPGSICLYWPDKKVLITGDVIFYGSIGRTDLPGGSISELKRSIDKLSSLDVEYLVPGHSTEYGSIIKGKTNIERNFQSVKLFF
jgi:glyoxylase-like metal-dependent hydrolase (beta-lactamase superfamily II)